MTLQTKSTQRKRALQLLSKQGMARLSELIRAGATAATVSRLTADGSILRLSRGLYQLPEALTDTNHSLAEAAKLVPRGVVCLVSALAFHELTDRIPSTVWMAIGSKDWRPRVTQPPIHFVRFSPHALQRGVERPVIEGVTVTITDPAHTIIDLFRYRHTVGQSTAIGGLKEILRQRRATPADIARLALQARVWSIVEPYLDALTAGG
jgi:predicted transcriptional regulator of viral defense system